MRRFEHVNATTVEEAVSTLSRFQGAARPNAGGTDLLGGMRDGIWPAFPKGIVNLKTIPGLSFIREEADGLRIGALTTLTEIAESPLIQDQCQALAEAAERTASPLIRNLATLAGNICQENRCWYYRYSEKQGGRIDCARKGGKNCLAVSGDHRFHSVFGAVKKCIAVNPSDTAPALVVLRASVKTNKRLISIDDFFTAKNGMKSTVLEDDELVTEIRIPKQAPGLNSRFVKIAMRKTIDFAIVSCAVAVTLEDNAVSSSRICLNGVHLNPYRPTKAEEWLQGRPLNAPSADEAGVKALEAAKPLPMNRYKVQMARSLVSDTLLACS